MFGRLNDFGRLNNFGRLDDLRFRVGFRSIFLVALDLIIILLEVKVSVVFQTNQCVPGILFRCKFSFKLGTRGDSF